MPSKGNLDKGSRVVAELSVDPAAQGSAELAMSFADTGEGSGADSRAVAPGATDGVELQTRAEHEGRLIVRVDFSAASDAGRLTVRVDGALRNQEPIQGGVTWTYSLS